AMKHLEIHVDVILMTAFGTVERAVEAMQAGAVDFIVKPIKRASLLRALNRVLERARLQHENSALRVELAALKRGSELLGVAPPFRLAVERARQAAASDATLLVLGESGTGKELVAREIHARSRRASGPFVAVHCAALPESIIESELFGHEAGAFTGAVRRKMGQLEAATGGTLFLDEIGELSPSVQVKLLRALQEGEIVRVGATRPTRIDVRVVAATHRDLERMVSQGEFRADLYYRVNVVAITLPPLRERPEDVALLSTHFLEQFGRDKEPGVIGFTPEARSALARWQWPGNVRELQNVVERAVVLDQDGQIDVDDLPPAVASGTEAAKLVIPVGTSMADAERRLIEATLVHTSGDKALAASVLGVGRRTIYRKLEEYAAEDDA
ncbi:MAG: two-component system response regulator HydG, partial [Bradymonadia bacterium]